MVAAFKGPSTASCLKSATCICHRSKSGRIIIRHGYDRVCPKSCPRVICAARRFQSEIVVREKPVEDRPARVTLSLEHDDDLPAKLFDLNFAGTIAEALRPRLRMHPQKTSQPDKLHGGIAIPFNRQVQQKQSGKKRGRCGKNKATQQRRLVLRLSQLRVLRFGVPAPKAQMHLHPDVFDHAAEQHMPGGPRSLADERTQSEPSRGSTAPACAVIRRSACLNCDRCGKAEALQPARAHSGIPERVGDRRQFCSDATGSCRDNVSPLAGCEYVVR